MEQKKKSEELDAESNVPDEDGWDPAHLAATIVIFIVAMGLLFWLFWSLMVCKSVFANTIAGIILLILIGEVIYIFK